MDDSDAKCSFCGKTKDEVRKLIAGGGGQLAKDPVPPPVSICSECVAICASVCAEDNAELASDVHVALEELVRITRDVLHGEHRARLREGDSAAKSARARPPGVVGQFEIAVC